MCSRQTLIKTDLLLRLRPAPRTIVSPQNLFLKAKILFVLTAEPISCPTCVANVHSVMQIKESWFGGGSREWGKHRAQATGCPWGIGETTSQALLRVEDGAGATICREKECSGRAGHRARPLETSWAPVHPGTKIPPVQLRKWCWLMPVSTHTTPITHVMYMRSLHALP